MEIFVAIDGKKTGPMSIYEVRELLRKDRINTSTLAWVKGMTKWEPLKECPPFRNSIDIEIAEADRDSIIINSEERKSILEASPNIYKPKPWIRLWAKLIDLPINIFLGILFLNNYLGKTKFNELIGPEPWPTPPKNIAEFWNYLDALQKAQPEFGIQILITLSICLSWIITEGLLMAIFSTTLGKWSFNIKTSKIDGKRVDPLSALKRSFLVVFLGFGFLFELLIIIFPIISYISLSKRKTTQWDRWLKIQVTHNELIPFKIIVGTISCFLVFNLVGLLLLSPEPIIP